MSVVGGKADVPATWPGSLLIAKSRSSGDTGKMLFTFRRAKPDARNRHVRFDERCALQAHEVQWPGMATAAKLNVLKVAVHAGIRSALSGERKSPLRAPAI